jgi:carbon-monoxide dehydrogenase large subunit
MSDTRFVNLRAVGSPVLPDEAIPLVEGDGRFLNDIKLAGMYHMAFLRSQHAHARLRSVDASKARQLPGVIKVLTGKELQGKVDPFRSMPNRFSGGESVQHWLAVDKVRFCGEAICAVVAEDRATAEDAVELVDFDKLHRRGRRGAYRSRLRTVAGGDRSAPGRARRRAARA